jgi:ParB family transcriptional regulator, chromosome partitioning protein
MTYEIKRIALSEIDQADDAFRITTNTDVESLCDAIQTVGMINSPVLVETDHTAFRIVCGFRRIAAATLLGRQTIRAAVLDVQTNDLDCARIAVADNIFQRTLNLIEISRALRLLDELLENSDQLANEAAILGLPDNAGVMHKLKGLCRLPKAVQEGILSSAISLPVAIEIDAMPVDEGRCYAEIFNRLRPSLNKQREIMVLVQEIASREDISVLHVLNDPNIEEILNHADLDRSRKLQKVRAFLKTRRFPAITHAEKTFETHVKKMKLGSGIKLVPPKNFEGSDYTLVVDFKNLKELEERIGIIEEMKNHPALAKILS